MLSNSAWNCWNFVHNILYQCYNPLLPSDRIAIDFFVSQLLICQHAWSAPSKTELLGHSSNTVCVEALLTDTPVSGQLYLQPPSEKNPFFSSPIQTLYFYQSSSSYGQPPFTGPKGVRLWELPLQFSYNHTWSICRVVAYRKQKGKRRYAKFLV